MIKIPSLLEIGQYFYSKDSLEDIGIYRVRELGDGVKTHQYVGSTSTLDEAVNRINKLNISESSKR